MGNAGIVFSVSESWSDFIANDLIAQCIRQHAFESVSDFDRYFPVLFSHQDQYSVILSFLSDLIRVEQTDAEVADFITAQRRQDDNDDLIRRAVFKPDNFFAQIRILNLVERLGQIGDGINDGGNLHFGKCGAEKKETARH